MKNINDIMDSIMKAAYEIYDKADKQLNPVLAIGCDCENNHTKEVVLGLHKTMLDRMKNEDYALNLTQFGIPVILRLTIADTYMQTVNNAIFILQSQPIEDWYMTAPTRPITELSLIKKSEYEKFYGGNKQHVTMSVDKDGKITEYNSHYTEAPNKSETPDKLN